MSNTQIKTTKRSNQANGELSDQELENVAGGRGFFNEIIAKGTAIEEARNHPVIQMLKGQL